MADVGWWLDEEAGRWVLLGAHGLPVPDLPAIAAALIPGRLAAVNRFLAGRLAPELQPGIQPWHCVLDGGAMDGHHEYLDPREYPRPPERLTLAWADPPAAEAACSAGGGAEVAVVLNRCAVYRRVTWCGHEGCLIPYRLDAR